MNPSAAAAALIIIAVSTILITSPSPATAATRTVTGQADDVSPKTPSLWRPIKQVHISNELGYNDSIMVHCTGQRLLSKEDLGVHYVGDGWEYTWRFRPSFFGVTRYSCYVAPVGDGMPVHSDFDAYVSGDGSFVEYENNVYWAVKRDSIYLRNVSAGGGSRDIWKHVWVPGKVNSNSNSME
ncbi:unnamed protein product [Linum trigynum]|uniref:S-protein homolog n=1 Tax=Linum trigynum TaxID=586398 RepID=A0AAV2D2K8_9ROSI